MTQQNIILSSLVFIVLLFSSCSGLKTYRDFKMSEVQKDEGVVLAKININYNGIKYNENCSVCFNSAIGSCIKLTSSGLVFLNLEIGKGSVKRLSCLDLSDQNYNIKGAEFKVKSGINYVGDITINWSNHGGFKATDNLGLLGALVDELRNDGSIVMNISEKNKDTILNQFSKFIGYTPKKINRSISSKGK